ncbi:MAG TPA: hypothetical protein PKB02_12500 [Anaerohalosphaeraceae bacterium]|jgi:hypothetical protein|nr:hypothetical protein [Anaerohalosphaeraceae bacterium]
MAKTPEKNLVADGTDANAEVRRFIDTLDDKHRMLVVLKSQLYGNRWEPMLEDLRNRLEGKPYIFKLVNRIKDDIDRIERMKSFEADYKVDLTEYIDIT